MSKKIVIIGAGEIGLAVGRLLADKKYAIEFWDKDSSVLTALGGEGKGLPEIVPGADALFFCVPSWALREALLYSTPYLSKGTVAVGMSKGVEANSQKTTDELLSALLPKKQPHCVLSGPMIAEELRAGGIGAAVVAADSPKVSRFMLELFAQTPLLLTESKDRRGVALCGILKNVFSLALGIAHGLSLGANARGLIVVMAVAEMKKIVGLLGGKQETVLGLSGLGDFIATGMSTDSKNHEAGRELVNGKISNMRSEGLVSLSSIVSMLGEKHKKLPLLSALQQIVNGSQSAEKAFGKLLLAARK